MPASKLGDVLAPWVFRQKAYRELPYGPMVFEARDLVVPAGTTSAWSSAFGTVTVDPHWAGMFSFSLEFAQPVNMGSNHFDIWWSGKDSDGNDSGVAFMQPPTSGTRQWSQASDFILPIGYNVFPDDHPMPDQVEMTVKVVVPPPSAATATDVRIVRARASLLLV